MAAFGPAYYGQSLSTCVNTILQKLLRQKRKAPTSEEKLHAYRKQDGKCEHCQGELDGAEEMDHCIPVKNAVAGQPVMEVTGWAAERLAEMTPEGHEAIIHVTLTDDHPWAQAFVVIEARPLAD